ncbi:MAG: sigma-70 family RNA polymerase sigma factor [Actinomycetota bacterium]|nr:sigma-70 family RNA polymerase sigma factor [Actinomycetota bacterium]
MSSLEVERYEESELVERATKGDQAAFTELVRAHQHEVYTLAVRMVSDRELAYDVAQEAFVRAWRAIERFRGDAKFSTWMHRITVNTAFTHRDRRKRTQTDSLDDIYREPESASLTPERGGESAAMRGPLEDALNDLPESLRAVVILKDVYEWSHTEIAEHLDISVTAAKVRLHRARKSLRLTLWKHQDEEES